MTTRRKAIKNLFDGLLVAGTGGLLFGTVASNASRDELVLRPPGALPEKEFQKACIKCGECVVACPYDTLKLGSAGDDTSPGTPYFEPRQIPCYMCTNLPCTEACPSGALDLKLLVKDSEPTINKAQMGLAVIHKESCIAFEGIQCDACYRACPLIGEAIELVFEKNEFTNKHANMLPVVNSEVCTGCGVCENACVVEKSAIFVLPRDKATGKIGDHYIKSWKEGDGERIMNQAEPLNTEDDVRKAMDYLNTDEELYD
jgi:ferredoxin-type protein NapG